MILDAATGAVRLRLQCAKNVRAVAYFPDGASVVTGSDVAQIWDAATGAERVRFAGEGERFKGKRSKLKGSIGEGSNHSNFSHQSSVKILSKFNAFC